MDAVMVHRDREGNGRAQPGERVLGAGELEVIASPMRRAILAALAEREATTGELAKSLGVPRSNLYYHLELLMGAGLVHIAREYRFGKLTIRYYGATASRFRLAVEIIKESRHG